MIPNDRRTWSSPIPRIIFGSHMVRGESGLVSISKADVDGQRRKKSFHRCCPGRSEITEPFSDKSLATLFREVKRYPKRQSSAIAVKGSRLIGIIEQRDLSASTLASDHCFDHVTYAKAGLLALGAKAVAEARSETARAIFMAAVKNIEDVRTTVSATAPPWFARGRLARQSITYATKRNPEKDSVARR